MDYAHKQNRGIEFFFYKSLFMRRCPLQSKINMFDAHMLFHVFQDKYNLSPFDLIIVFIIEIFHSP